MNNFNISEETLDCYNRLKKILSDLGSMFIAFSGGTDSTLLMEAALRMDNISVTAITVNSILLPEAELIKAAEYIKHRNIHHIILELDPLNEKSIAENSPLRCYYCKKFIFTQIKEIARENGIRHILDGTHHDDLTDYRPGMKAIEELEIISPLKSAGFKKNNIRELARHFGLDNWNSPAYPCLATRIPHGTGITVENLKLVENCEVYIHSLGHAGVRVRLHGELARIEIPSDRIAEFSSEETRKNVTKHLRELGIKYITLDLEGYRTGSMNINDNGETVG